MTNDLKLKIYPAVIAVLGLSLVALLLSRLEIRLEPVPPAEVTAPANEPALDSTPASPQPVRSPIPQPPVATPTAPKEQVSPPATVTPATMKTQVGSLRVSNQSNYPVRVALLPQQSESAAKVNQSTGSEAKEGLSYSQPVHWDFAPEEGETKGLILSLPNSNLQLHPGDVLVAFAQDGSRRYWGPYVVGKTMVPDWNTSTKEWRLVLQP